MAKKKKNSFEQAVESSFSRQGCNVQFNIFDLSKIHKAGMDAANAGQNIDEAVKLAIAKYRLN